MSFSVILDTSSIDLNIGLIIDDELEYIKSYNAWLRQSEYLIPELKKALDKYNLNLIDAENIYCTIGPGSYTGLRIALTVAIICCDLSKAKLRLISSLKAQGGPDEDYISIINARSNRSYVAMYSKGKTILKDQVLSNNEVLELIEKNRDFMIKGDVKHLQIRNDYQDNTVKNIYCYRDQIEQTDPLKARPVYLKDEYAS